VKATMGSGKNDRRHRANEDSFTIQIKDAGGAITIYGSRS
jgi:hypothetical protein